MPGSSFVTRVSIYYAQFKNAVSSTFLQAINAPKKKGPPDRTNIWTRVIAKNNLKTDKSDICAPSKLFTVHGNTSGPMKATFGRAEWWHWVQFPNGQSLVKKSLGGKEPSLRPPPFPPLSIQLARAANNNKRAEHTTKSCRGSSSRDL